MNKRIELMVLVVAVVLPLGASPMSSQSAAVSGMVVDSSTTEPVAGVAVRLVRLQTEADTLAVTTDEEGRFSFIDLPAGAYRLLADLSGYQQREHECELSNDEKLELPSGTLALVPMTQAQLPGVQVTGERIPVVMRGFYARREAGFGRFLTREQVEAKQPKTTYDVLREIPGIVVRPNPGYAFEGNSTRYIVESLRMASINDCPMLVFLNGVRVGSTRTVDLEFLISPNHVGAVEVYATVAGLPMEFNQTGSACGVIVFWSRFAEPTEP